MKKASICLLLSNNYVGTVYSFEKSGFKIVEKESEFVVKDAPKEYIKVIGNEQVELLVAYRKHSDARTIEYFKNIADECIELESDDNDATAYNKLFIKAKHEYVCIMQPDVFLQEHWLTELMHSHEIIDNSGVVSIPNNLDNVAFSPLLDYSKENFINVFIPNNNLVNKNGVCLFLRQYLYLIGAFDESVILDGNELNQFQMRCTAKGFNNYYIPSQSCIIIRDHKVSKNQAVSDENLKKTLAEMKAVKNYYIALMDDFTRENRNSLPE